MAPSAPDTTTLSSSRLVVSTLDEKDLPEAERILRVAFGTFLGAPDPETFWSDRDYIYGRRHAPHVASFAAMLDGKLVGSNFVTNWGSVGFLGPITVHPDVTRAASDGHCSIKRWCNSMTGERGTLHCLLSRTAQST